jgi:glutamate racemase
MTSRPIGIFDSGVGGLTVLREIEKVLPNENIIYFGDTARVPYGNKSRAAIIKFSIENMLFLLRKKVKIVIIACNTSSSLALHYLRRIFNLPIVGVIEAGAKKALEVSKVKRIGVIGTKSTINSKSYNKEILKIDRKVKVYCRACPLFVPLVEEKIFSGKIIEGAMEMYLRWFLIKKVDTVILGCTHYPLLKKIIAGYLRKVVIVDSAKEVALHTKNILKKDNLLSKRENKGKVDFYVTDDPERFVSLAKLFLKRGVPKPKVVNV